MMYSIGEIAKLTGITAFTLRYYEKIGLLPKPQRQNGKEDGIRRYDDRDLQFIRFIHGLKDTGMKLEDIAIYVEEGCLLERNDWETDDWKEDIYETLYKRIQLLETHEDHLDRQIKKLEAMKTAAREKRVYYLARLKEKGQEPGSKKTGG
ncbi:MerR family transcriptional regulator [Bacillus gobiensis]|uniref:MerR family transcriptional regulator n=1 Tax=Bacillus gobiensis TaxID=1441095 RepID=UPI003D200379